MVQDKKDLEFMMIRLIKEYEEWGLVVNQIKIKYLCIEQETENLFLNENVMIRTCNNCICLGTQIDSTGRTENEIEQRIQTEKRKKSHRVSEFDSVVQKNLT